MLHQQSVFVMPRGHTRRCAGTRTGSAVSEATRQFFQQVFGTCRLQRGLFDIHRHAGFLFGEVSECDETGEWVRMVGAGDGNNLFGGEGHVPLAPEDRGARDLGGFADPFGAGIVCGAVEPLCFVHVPIIPMLSLFDTGVSRFDTEVSR